MKRTTAFLSAFKREKCLFLRTWGKLEISPKSRPSASYRSSPETPSGHHIFQQGLGEEGEVLFRGKKEPSLDLERSELEPQFYYKLV